MRPRLTYLDAGVLSCPSERALRASMGAVGLAQEGWGWGTLGGHPSQLQSLVLLAGTC